jgi:Zn-dependent M28 family amino/carboxypeptidase
VGKIWLFALAFVATIGQAQTLPDDALRRGLDTITIEEVKATLAYLAGPELEGRGNGQPGNLKAREFIAKAFETYGLAPGGVNGYYQPFSGSANVIGFLEGQDPVLKNQYIVIGAHLDHLGKKNSTIYPGADDNASGTEALLEVAEAASRVRTLLNRSLVFIAFNAEESGLVGAEYYVDNPRYPLNKTVYMINLDMVGYLRNKSLECLGTGSSQSVSKLVRDLAGRYPEIVPDVSSSAGGGSDHVPFVQKGIKVTFFHTGMESVYHTPRDTPDLLNYEGLTSVSKYVFEVAANLAFRTEVPTTDAPIQVDEQLIRLDHGAAPFSK